MPSRRLHDLFTELLLGETFSWISAYMDEPYAQFRGRHRQLRHDTSALIRILEEHGLRAALAGMLHLILDENRELKRDVERVETLREASGSSEKNV